MRFSTQVKLLSISNQYSQITVKQTLTHIKLTVIEVPELNPYGRDYSNAVPFDIEIHNDNIKRFSVQPGRIGEIATVDMLLVPHKKDAAGQTPYALIVNNLDFQLPF